MAPASPERRPVDAGGRSGRTTIVDVARAAGYSVATVSRALRGLSNVAPDTVATVRQVAEALGYRPNLVAAQLRSGATRAVTIVVPAIQSWYYAEVMASAQVVLDQHGYRTFVLVSNEDEGIERVLNLMGLGRVDGLIVVDLAVGPDTASELSRLGVAVVAAGLAGPGVASIRVDDQQLGHDATRHLIDLGHRRIAAVSWGGRHPRNHSTALRLAGYRQALEAARIPVDPRLELAVGRSDGGTLHAAGLLAGRRELPSAAFCLTDKLAIGVARTFGDLGFDLPAELSVVGVGDVPTAEVVGLTTMSLPVRELGSSAARLLLHQIDQGDVGDEVVFTAGLVVRRSTGPPRVP